MVQINIATYFDNTGYFGDRDTDNPFIDIKEVELVSNNYMIYCIYNGYYFILKDNLRYENNKLTTEIINVNDLDSVKDDYFNNLTKILVDFEIKDLKFQSEINTKVKSYSKVAWGVDPHVCQMIDFSIENKYFKLKKSVEIGFYYHDTPYDFNYKWERGKIEDTNAFLSENIIREMWDIAVQNIEIFRNDDVLSEVNKQIELQSN